MYRPVPSCSCNPRCSCDALIRVRDYFRTEQIIRFLRGLNPGFGSVRSQILRSDPLPTINQVYAMVAQEEQEIGGGVPEIPRDAAVAAAPVLGSAHVLAAGGASTNAGGFKRGTKRPICTYCGLIGHSIEKCYRKIGYPPGYRNKGKGVAAANTVNAVAVTGAEISSGDVGGGSTSDGDSGNVTISAQQYQALYSLFQGHGSASSALGPAPGGIVSCVNKVQEGGSRVPTPDAQYVPTSSQGPTPSEDIPAATQGPAYFADDWYS